MNLAQLKDSKVSFCSDMERTFLEVITRNARKSTKRELRTIVQTRIMSILHKEYDFLKRFQVVENGLLYKPANEIKVNAELREIRETLLKDFNGNGSK